MPKASDDPRVVASRQRLLTIPRWRVIQTFKAQRKHLELLNRVTAEQRANEPANKEHPHG